MTATPLEVVNPFEEDVAPARRLQHEVPPSKHAKGRHKPMRDSDKRLRRRRTRARIQAALDAKAVANG